MKILKFIFFISLFLGSLLSGISQSEIPSAPNPAKLYNNLSKVYPSFLTSKEAIFLEKKLSDFAINTSNQIVILIVDTLNGYEPWDYATRIGEKWQIGQQKEDNGIVILIKPTGGKGQRKTFISPGRGLESVIPDAVCNQIVKNELLPYFKNQQFFEGLDVTTDILMELSKNEYSANEYLNKNEDSPILGFIFFLLFVLIFGYSFIRSVKRIGLFRTILLFTILSKSSSISSGRSRSRFQGSSGNNPGFGGFGGGSFGGGGAGGSW
jgi:uncharacterized protein